MPGSDDTPEREPSPDPLAAVAGAAAARLRAQTNENTDAEHTASEELMTATMSAMSGGYSLRDITAAEARGETGVRRELRSDVLKRVDRAARHVRDAEDGYRTAVGRALRLGLSTRDIAQSAGVTHGTIRAIAQRLEPSASESAAASDVAAETTRGDETAAPGTAHT